MKTEKKAASPEKVLLIEAILDHEEKHSSGIYGMRYCQLCGKTQSYSGMYGAMAADSVNPFRCRSCRVESGKHMLDRWFKGSMQACIDARRYTYCQFCGTKVPGTKPYMTKVRGLCYLCEVCDRDFKKEVSQGKLPHKVWWRQNKRLYLEWLDIKVLQLRNKYNRENALKAKQRQLQLRLIKL
jgi:hypothetical protein